MRLRAIILALWHGLAPWWLYESECHYAPMSYREHLACNLRYALRWARGAQTFGDMRFELATNGHPG